MTPAEATRRLFGAQAAGASRVLASTSAQSSLTGADRLALGWKRIEQLGVDVKVARSTEKKLWMSVDDELRNATLDWLDAVAPAVGGAFHKHFTPFVQAAIDSWPVRTGLSRSLLVAGIQRVGEGEVEAELVGGAPCTLIIRWGAPKTVRAARSGAQRRRQARATAARPASTFGLGSLAGLGLGKGFRPGESVWWSLVRRPHAKLAPAMAETIQEVLDGRR